MNKWVRHWSPHKRWMPFSVLFLWDPLQNWMFQIQPTFQSQYILPYGGSKVSLCNFELPKGWDRQWTNGLDIDPPINDGCLLAFSSFGIHCKIECFKCSQLFSHNLFYCMDRHRCFYRSFLYLHVVRYTVIEKLAAFETFNFPMDPERKRTVEAIIVYGRSLSNPFVPCLYHP